MNIFKFSILRSFPGFWDKISDLKHIQIKQTWQFFIICIVQTLISGCKLCYFFSNALLAALI